MKLSLFYHTVMHLRPIQMFYQIWYRARRLWRKSIGFKYRLSIEKQGTPLRLKPWIEKSVSLTIYPEFDSNLHHKDAALGFTLLNLSKKYRIDSINWCELEHGRLWAYNLNYMDYLLQPETDVETRIQLIQNFIRDLPENTTGIEPYPIALRGINWIKLLSYTEGWTRQTQMKNFVNFDRNNCKEYPRLSTEPLDCDKIKEIDSSLYAQYQILFDNLEYHLLGNHLLEDMFSLLFASYYFKDERFFEKARYGLLTQLREQVLIDGGHCERSPMYHQIILDRLLDVINLVSCNHNFQDENMLNLLEETAIKMLEWLNEITFSNGQIPLLNDAAPGIAPTTNQLNKYAARLGIKKTRYDSHSLSDSGYRKFVSPFYECIINIGQISPSYQPGHAHADTFNLVLNVENKPMVVDTGVSTYDIEMRRLNERGTAAHNTVTVNDKNSSEVWSAFRIARRAEVTILKDDEKEVIARHNGYRRMGTTHQRKWSFSEERIEITDSLTGNITEGKAHFWLSPGCSPTKRNDIISINNTEFIFNNAKSVKLLPVELPNGYNRFEKTYKIEIEFHNKLESIISCG